MYPSQVERIVTASKVIDPYVSSLAYKIIL